MDATPLAESLCVVLAELILHARYGELLALDLSSSPCRGRAERLIVGQRDVDGTEHTPLIRRCWVADVDGFRADPGWRFWPKTKQFDEPGFYERNPRILFATDGHAVRLCCHFGQNWSRYRLGRVRESGRIVPGSVVAESPYS